MYRTAFLLLAAATPLAANAQTAPAPQAGAAAPAAGAATAAAPTVGATVVDTQGNTVGTIASTDGTNAVVDTGTVKAAVPLSSFGTGPKGPTLAMTKAELEAAAGQGAAQAAAQFQSQLTTSTIDGRDDQGRRGRVRDADHAEGRCAPAQGVVRPGSAGRDHRHDRRAARRCDGRQVSGLTAGSFGPAVMLPGLLPEKIGRIRPQGGQQRFRRPLLPLPAHCAPRRARHRPCRRPDRRPAPCRAGHRRPARQPQRPRASPDRRHYRSRRDRR